MLAFLLYDSLLVARHIFQENECQQVDGMPLTLDSVYRGSKSFLYGKLFDYVITELVVLTNISS